MSTSTLQRSATDTKVAGVCGGVAERWGLDPVLVRVGAVLLALTGGVGVILYLAGWLLLPVAGTQRAAVDDVFGGAAARWPRELWVTLVVLASILAFGAFGAISPFGAAPAIALLALWWFGFHRPRVRRSRAAGAATSPSGASESDVLAPPATPAAWSGPSTPFTQAAAAWQTRVHEVRSGGWSPTPQAAPEPPATWPAGTATTATTAPPAAPADPEALARAAFLAEPDPVGLYREPDRAAVPAVRPGRSLSARRLRLVTLVALGLTWLGLGVADALGVAVGVVVYAGSGLLVLALGLVAATRWGRARGLLPAATVLAVGAVLASSLASPTLPGPTQVGVQGMFGHRVGYTSSTGFPADGDRLDVGDLHVDLSGLSLTSDATYRAVVDTGRVVVRTPRGVGVALRYHVDTGDVRAYGSTVADGSALSGDRLVVPPAAGQRTLTLDLTVDTGVVEVRS